MYILNASLTPSIAIGEYQRLREGKEVAVRLISDTADSSCTPFPAIALYCSALSIPVLYCVVSQRGEITAWLIYS